MAQRVDNRYILLSEICDRYGVSAREAFSELPAPSFVKMDGEGIALWEQSVVQQWFENRVQSVARQHANRMADMKREITEAEATLSRLNTDITYKERELRQLQGVIKSIEISADGAPGTDPKLWSWEAPLSLPTRLHGVYRLIKDHKIAYIGQSIDIFGRIATHAHNKDFDQFSYALVDGGKDALNEIESALIIIERPPGNHSRSGQLQHPTGHRWSQAEAEAVLRRYKQDEERRPVKGGGYQNESSSVEHQFGNVGVPEST